MKIATIDVGTNTANLLIAEVTPPNRLVPIEKAKRFIRLGEGVDAERMIRPAAMARLREALLVFKGMATAQGVEEIVVTGTSASRDAINKEALVQFVKAETGLSYEVLTGEEEARWTFQGALAGLPDLLGPCAVIDIGGGSTELILDAVPQPLAQPVRRSYDIGSVRLHERFFVGRLGEQGATDRATAWIQGQLSAAPLPLDAGATFIGAAGTLVALALVHHAVDRWEALPHQPVVIPASVVTRWRRRLSGMPPDAVLALNPVALSGREDVFGAGIMILDEVMQVYGFKACRVSPYGLRHGIALRSLHG